jgi:hypothetical protein
MAVDLIAFVCEGPTCSDRWDSATPRRAVVDGLMHQASGEARERCQIVVVREICLGHCQRGPTVLIMPVPRSQLGEAQWLGPDESSAGARIHHPRTTAQAAALILAASSVASGTPMSGGAAELSVATNPELA